jgi:uncharacterized membrane protein
MLRRLWEKFAPPPAESGSHNNRQDQKRSITRDLICQERDSTPDWRLQLTMSKPTRWLFGELERWKRERIITEEQAGLIRALYPDTTKRSSWGLILFSGLGAAVIGLGVILLLAYNWQDIPKFGKLALIFGSMALAHATGLWLRWKSRPQPEIGGALSLLGTLLFGAGIWLVAQVYHIDEHFPNGFLFWGIGALALMWALGSVPQGIVAVLTLTAWNGTELFHFDAPAGWGAPLVLAGIGSFAWLHRSAILGAVVLAACDFMLAAHAGYWNGPSGAFTAIFAISGLLLAAVRLRPDDESLGRLRAVMTFFGWGGFAVCAYILSFKGAVRDMLRWTNSHEAGWASVVTYRWIFFVLAAIGWGWVLLRKLKSRAVHVPMEEWLCPIALIYAQGLAVAGYYEDRQFVALVFNVICLGIATMWMVRGCREGRLRPTVCGSLFFAALVFARYFDLFESLAVRGVVFLLLGGVLFAEGFYYRRLRHESAGLGGAS